MAKSEKHPEISESEIAVIERFLSRNKSGAIKNFETLDGFLTALIIGPDFVPPSEYMPVITSGSANDNGAIFSNGKEVEQFFDILMRHWNHVNEKYYSGDIYMLYLAEDDQGQVRGNDWATGFITGTELRHSSWAVILNDDELSGSFIPIFALKYENSDDLSLRPYEDPISEEQREKLLTFMIAGVKKLYDIFRESDDVYENAESMPVPSKGKTGRNDLCPCGSGKKFKKCCGLKTFH